MSHPEQRAFCEKIKLMLPDYFWDVYVLDVGSYDVNGNNRYLFAPGCFYWGIDIRPGPNVDEVVQVQQCELGKPPDIIISTEMLEHDPHWIETLKAMIGHLRHGGMLLFTCASGFRNPHGDKDYYKNLDENDIREALDLDELFLRYAFETGKIAHYPEGPTDLYFWGVKR